MRKRDQPLSVPPSPLYATIPLSRRSIVVRRAAGARGHMAWEEASQVLQQVHPVLVADAKASAAILKAQEEGAEWKEIAESRDRQSFYRALQLQEQVTGWLLLHMWADPEVELETAAAYHAGKFADAEDPVSAVGQAVYDECLADGWTEADWVLTYKALNLVQQRTQPTPTAMRAEGVERMVDFFGPPSGAPPT